MTRYAKTHWQDPAVDRLLSQNRDRYMAQSALTRKGRVGRLPSLSQSIRLLRRLYK